MTAQHSLSREHTLPAPETAERKDSLIPPFLLAAAVFYNACLAFINAHGLVFGMVHVAVCEALILLAATGFVISRFHRMPAKKHLIVASFAFYLALGLWVSLANGTVFLHTARNFAIISLFFLVGTQSSPAQMIRTFSVVAAATVSVMLVEGFLPQVYVWLFQPAEYFSNTRGIEALATDSSGLFRNSLGFAGRFSFGLFDQRRLSSVFMEQVSLANFSMVLCILAITWWNDINSRRRIIFAGTVLFMVVSNSSRTSIALCLLMVLGYTAFPRLPRSGYMLVMPLVLAAATIMFIAQGGSGSHLTDDMSGRIGHTINLLLNMDLSDFVIGNIPRIAKTGDSGYAFIVYASTIFGLLYFWIFLSTVLPSAGAEARRFSYALLFYISINLLVGAAIFSIKVNAPLWMIAGCLAARESTRKSQHD
ncbi:hypothetical protein [Magnetospirillum fulvum]|uniref:Putative polymerase n=1 Tax=Magnetospirillum fulvum TaxID=1082 RepID=A0A1H6HEM2_MAGFU|nr:hypothetical protein [Magnetospirillum fulvum]SEH32685.1 putative polymerase [Magnetospirillum fulvum]